MSNARGVLARCAFALLLAVGIGMGLVGSASAHDVLISSDPKDGATVAIAPSTITFTFDQPVQNFEPVVSLVGPDGKQYATGTPAINGNAVTGSVTAGPGGAYTAAYRIVSADGHPVTGEIHFTLTGDGGAPAPSRRVTADSGPAAAVTGTSSAGPSARSGATGAAAVPAPATAATSTSQAAAAGSSSGGLSAWLWIGLIVAALVIAAAAVILLRRPAGRPSAGRSGGTDY